jgi:hypothetical protein
VVQLATAAGGGDRAWATSEDGHHWNHWRREVLAYQRGFAATVYVDAGLGAPRLLATVAPRPGVVALWLEDVAGLPGARWPVGRLAEFAARLGTAQAGWAGREPPHPWLSRRWLRQYVASKPIAEPVAWEDPRVSAVWPMNLIARGGPGAEIVLLDWAFAGAGAVGEDVGNLIPDSVADGLIDPALLPEIEAAVTGGYLAGLRAGGWRGRDGEVRRAIAVTGAAKYCWLAPRMLQRLDGGGRAGFYDRRGTGQALTGRLGMLALVAGWGRLALGDPG